MSLLFLLKLYIFFLVMKPYHREMGREGKVLNLDRGFIFHIPPFKFVIIQQKKQKKQED